MIASPVRAALALPVATDWREALPVLEGRLVTLREIQRSDVPSLLALLTTDEVARFMSPPPATVDRFERFVAWAHRERRNGMYASFAVVPHGTETASGLFQVHRLALDADIAEWGAVLARDLWGTGAFVDGARLVIDFAFDVLGVRRLEARAAAANGRGNGALRKIGAVQEAVLRQSLVHRGERLDQVLWSILASDWHHAKTSWTGPARVH